MRQAGFFDLDVRLKRLSDIGDQLETYSAAIDFEMFRADLEAAVNYSDGSKGGRPPYDVVMMFKILIIQAQHNLSDDRAEFLITDRLSFMRFLGLDLNDRGPDAKTIWLFRERLTQAGVMKGLFAAFEAALQDQGYKPVGGQIVDASLIAAPRQRMTTEEKSRAKAGEDASDIWPDKPAKAAQKDTDARWMVKYSKARKTKEGDKDAGLVDISVPHFGYKNHISIDRKWRFIRGETTTDAARYDGHELTSVLARDNSSGKVWADTAYRTKSNEAWLKANGFFSHIHRKKPKGKPMPRHIERGNATRSIVRTCVEHVFGHQKGPMDLSIRTIGIKRAATKMTLANLTYNMKRLIFHERRKATA